MALRFKTVEELNMEVKVEPTVEEQVQELKGLVVEDIEVCERMLSIAASRLNFHLYEKELVSNASIDNEFDIVYHFINEFCSTFKYRCEKLGVSDEVQSAGVADFKQIKSKARKTKAELKKMFADLKEELSKQMENEEYVANISNQVQEEITNWCKTYVIKDYYKSDFVDAGLARSVACVTKHVLSSKLNPNSNDVISFVERFMGYKTETVAC